MARDGRGGEKGLGVVCSRGHTRKYTFPIPFCMIPHRGRTSTRLVGTGAAERSFKEKTQPSPLTRLEATDGIRGRGRQPRGRKGLRRGLFLCRKLTEEIWSAGRSRLSWSVDNRHAGRRGVHVDESWGLFDLAK